MQGVGLYWGRALLDEGPWFLAAPRAARVAAVLFPPGRITDEVGEHGASGPTDLVFHAEEHRLFAEHAELRGAGEIAVAGASLECPSGIEEPATVGNPLARLHH